MIDKKVIELVAEIATKAVECNRAERTEGDIIKTFPEKRQAPTVFFEFSGHTNEIGIRVYKNGWKESTDCDFRTYVYLDDEIGDTICKLNEILTYLKELEDNHEKNEKDT